MISVSPTERSEDLLWPLNVRRSCKQQESDRGDEAGSQEKVLVDNMTKLLLDDNRIFETEVHWRNRAEEDEGFRAYLNEVYPSWEGSHETYFIPKYDFVIDKNKEEAGIVAEKKIVQKLQALNEPDMFVIHGHNFAEKVRDFCVNGVAKWLRGECDICLIHKKYGIFFIEVKSGKSGVKSKYKDGLEQTKKDKEAILSFITKYGKNEGLLKSKQVKLLKQLIMGRQGFVALTDCQKDCAPKADNIIHADHIKTDTDFRSWFEENVVKTAESDSDKMKKAVPVLNDPGVMFVLLERFLILTGGYRTLKYEIDGFDYLVTKVLTPQQLQYLGQPPCELWINGPAGSGKTDILIAKVQELAEMITARNLTDKVFVTCYNKPLAEYLSMTFKEYDVVKVETYEHLLSSLVGMILGETYDVDSKQWQKCARVRELIDTLKENKCCGFYDHVFVDESQDLVGNWYELLHQIHKTEDFGEVEGEYNETESSDEETSVDSDNTVQSTFKLKGKYMWIIYDPNQEINFREMPKDLLAVVNKSMKYGQDLNVVIRNTGAIFEEFKKFALPTSPCKMKLGHQTQGRDIKWIIREPNDMARATSEELMSLLSQGVQPGKIAILTSTKSKAMELRESLKRLMFQYSGVRYEFTDAERWAKEGRWECNFTVVESVRRFKGLDNKVIILFDPYNFHQDTFYSNKGQRRKILYVAYSRASCLLIIVTNEENRLRLTGHGKSSRKRAISGRLEDDRKRIKALPDEQMQY